MGGESVFVLTDKGTIMQFEQSDFQLFTEYVITKDTETNEIKIAPVTTAEKKKEIRPRRPEIKNNSLTGF